MDCPGAPRWSLTTNQLQWPTRSGPRKRGHAEGRAGAQRRFDLPTEATDPARCGVLAKAPNGGMATGSGGAAAGQNTALIALGGGALLAARPPIRRSSCSPVGDDARVLAIGSYDQASSCTSSQRGRRRFSFGL